ncbi:hypothetical protein Leryth_020296 [Lithospermum erythrorhizon]|uniref:Cysteine protease n=1 Tax=Lithospermum erythrorhizon TaxID=34254 RepID=A0AAV3R226_LITER|nr:hypothetical protein Leryth_020296 [Lithospermum erythrorhizon]
MAEVILHIYDVTNSGSDQTNTTIMQINKIFKDGIGIGGIFHSAVQVFGADEWSFGYCEDNTGVFSCPARENPLYTYRESLVLGKTDCSLLKVNQILRELSKEWPGRCYDLLSKNCNHFCDEFCERLGVPKLPGWVNRFAHAGDAAMDIAETTALTFRQAKTEIVSASKAAYQFLVGVSSAECPSSPEDSTRESSALQSAWFPNFTSIGAKPSSSSNVQSADDVELRPQQQPDSEAPPRQTMRHI